MSVKLFIHPSFEVPPREKEECFYSEEETQRICQEFYQKGFKEGKNYQDRQKNLSSQADIHQKNTQVLFHISKTLESWSLSEGKKRSCVQDDVHRMVKECLDILFPYVKDRVNASNIEGLIQNAFDVLSKDIKISIKLSEHDRESLSSLLTVRFPCAEIDYQKDIPSGHCYIEWESGGCFWEPENVYKALLELLKSKKS